MFWFSLCDTRDTKKINRILSFTEKFFYLCFQAEIVNYHGYPSETHHVTTADGYILQLTSIPRGKKNNIQKMIPVLLIHGLLDSADIWVLNTVIKAWGLL